MFVYEDEDLDINEIIDRLDDYEKKEMFEALLEEFDRDQELMWLDNDELIAQLQGMNAFQLKKLLCNTFAVPSYYDEITLRSKLEPIFKAS